MHGDLQITLGVYARSSTEGKSKALAQFSELFE